ncbi:MAG: hypothetical protein CMC56_01495 [Flavobacteriaceae bacterium]|nr:hypothetical protein [Flavobacteriaceae bacterium]
MFNPIQVSFKNERNLNFFKNEFLFRQGDFNPFGPKDPTPRRYKRKQPRFEFLGAVGIVLGMLGVIGFLLFHLLGFQIYLLITSLFT